MRGAPFLEAQSDWQAVSWPVVAWNWWLFSVQYEVQRNIEGSEGCQSLSL